MQRPAYYGIPSLLLLFGIGACTSDRSPAAPSAASQQLASASVRGDSRFLVAFSDRKLPADFAARVRERGGTVDEVLAGPGIAIVSGLTSEAAGDLAATAGIDAVAADMTMSFGTPDEGALSSEPATGSPLSLSTEKADDGPKGKRLPSEASYYGSQWNMRIIHADAAWNDREFGSPSVKVYLLDTGIDYTRPDLEGRVDPERSISLVPNDAAGEMARAQTEGVAPYMDFHSHGTAVASTIVGNGVDLAGVTTKTRIVAVKVLDRTRVGQIVTFVRGIDYAAKNGADVIHLSMPHPGFSRSSANAAAMMEMMDRATTYAHEQGAVIIVAGGNNKSNLDDPSWWRGCNAAHVVCVSATTANDRPASYTNHGVNTITVAGPGGDEKAGELKVLVNCSSFSLITTGNPAPCGAGGPRFETTGTTFGAAATSGLAALIISRIGRGQPDRVREVLVQSADDLGEQGRDKYYGYGRINVARALELSDDRNDKRRAEDRRDRIADRNSRLTP